MVRFEDEADRSFFEALGLPDRRGCDGDLQAALAVERVGFEDDCGLVEGDEDGCLPRILAYHWIAEKGGTGRG